MGALWTGTTTEVRDFSCMGALWTGIHFVRAPYGPEPTLATINLYRGVSSTTYNPTTGVTLPTARGYGPDQAKIWLGLG